MKISAINQFYSPVTQNIYSKQQRNSIQENKTDYNPAFYYPLNFKSAADISLKYVYENRAKYLPKRILEEIESLIKSGKEDSITLQELHNKVYGKLFRAESLDEVRRGYEEFEQVKSAEEFATNRSKAVKAVQAIMPLEDFSLDLLKKLYSLTPTDKLVQEYGFTNRSLLLWFMDKLNIPKLDGSYIILVKMSNEAENQKVAETTRRLMQENPERREQFFQSAAEGHRTPEYAQRHSQKMKNFYDRNPEQRERVSRVSTRTWELCPEVKEAMSAFSKVQEPYVQMVIMKSVAGKKLTARERRVMQGFRDRFWAAHPEYRQIISKARKQAYKEDSDIN